MSIWNTLGLSSDPADAARQNAARANNANQSNRSGLDQRAANAEDQAGQRAQDALNRQGPAANWGQSQGDYGQQQQNIADQNSLAALMNQRAQGKGPSVAELQMQQGQAQAAANAQAAAAGTRGGGLAQTLAARGAAEQNAGAQQAAVGQGAALRASEMTQAQNSLAGLYGQQAQAEAAMRSGSQQQAQNDVANQQQNYAQQQQAAQNWAGQQSGSLGQQYASTAQTGQEIQGQNAQNQQETQWSTGRGDKWGGAIMGAAGSMGAAAATSDVRAKTDIQPVNSADHQTQMDMLYHGLDPDPSWEGATARDRMGQGAVPVDGGGMRRAMSTGGAQDAGLQAALAGYGGQATRDTSTDKLTGGDIQGLSEGGTRDAPENMNGEKVGPTPAAAWVDHTGDTAESEQARASSNYAARDPNKAAFDQQMHSGSKGGASPNSEASPWGAGLSNVGAAFSKAFGAPGMASDERCKEDKRALGDNAITDMLRATPPYQFRYKDPARDGAGPRVGVMAQDLERTPAGRTMVYEDPTGKKVIDPKASLSALLASAAQMQREIDALKSKKGGR